MREKMGGSMGSTYCAGMEWLRRKLRETNHTGTHTITSSPIKLK